MSPNTSVATTTPPGNDSRREDVDQEWGELFRWVEDTLGGEIVARHRQPRWRPCWFLDVQSEGVVRTYFLRAQREGAMPWTRSLTVEREYRIMKVLQDEGVRVPHVYGLCPDPSAMLMEAVQGRGQESFDERDDPATRDAILQEYIEILAEAHAIDPEKFVVDAGLRMPRTPQAIGLGGFELTEKWYRSIKKTPEPITEFIVQWVNRNVPTHRERVCWNAWDTPQFLHEGGKCLCMLDLEFSMLGDPLNDLAAMRWRSTAQDIGDLTKAYRHYAELTGERLEKSVINYQAVRFCAVTPTLSLAERLDPSPEFDNAQWESWSLIAQFVALEVIAEELGIDLREELEEAPAVAPTRRRPLLLSPKRILDQIFDELPADDFLGYRLRTAREQIDAVLRADEVGAALEERDREDEARLLGHRPVDWREGDQLLEEYVLAAGPEQDAELVRFLYRRVRRQIEMLKPMMREMRDLRFQRVDWEAVGAVDA
jgi:aminoglycoside phosphotransferase (APT) family kinase protein